MAVGDSKDSCPQGTQVGGEAGNNKAKAIHCVWSCMGRNTPGPQLGQKAQSTLPTAFRVTLTQGRGFKDA